MNMRSLDWDTILFGRAFTVNFDQYQLFFSGNPGLRVAGGCLFSNETGLAIREGVLTKDPMSKPLDGPKTPASPWNQKHIFHS